jgi:hypothetical protein
VRIDNGRWRSTPGHSLKFKNAPAGTHRVAVYAVDMAGNRGRTRSKLTSI